MTEQRKTRWLASLAPPFLLIVVIVLPRILAAAHLVTPARDMIRYVAAAEMLADKPLLEAVRTMDCHPLYPALLLATKVGVVDALGGEGTMAWVYAGEVLGVGAFILFMLTSYAFGAYLWNRTAAFWGCAFVALLPRQISYTVDVLTDSVHAWLWMTSLLLMTQVDRGRPAWWFAGAGIVAGLAYWTRAEALLLPIMAMSGLAILQVIPRWRMTGSTAAACAAVFAVGWGIPFGSYVGAIGRLSPRNSAAALTGGDTTAESVVAASAHVEFIANTQIPRASKPTTLDVALAETKDGDLGRVELAPRPYQGNEAYEYRSIEKAAFALAYEFAQETRVWMLPFIAWGAAIYAFRGSWRRAVFAVLGWIGYCGILILLQMRCGYIAGRYLMPVMPCLSLLAAIGAQAYVNATIWFCTSASNRWAPARQWRPRKWRSAAIASVALLAVGTSAPAWFRSNHRHRQSYLDAAAWLKEHTKPGEAVFDPVELVGFFAERPLWRPTDLSTPPPVRYAVVDVDRVYRCDPLTHLAIRRVGSVGRPVAEFVQRKSRRNGVVYIFEIPSAARLATKGELR